MLNLMFKMPIQSHYYNNTYYYNNKLIIIIINYYCCYYYYYYYHYYHHYIYNEHTQSYVHICAIQHAHKHTHT